MSRTSPLPPDVPRSDGVAPARPVGCTSFRLRQLTRRVSQHFDRHLSAAGMKTTQYSLLAHVERFGPVSPGELARRMSMDASTLTRNLRPLLAQGWAELGAGADARSRVVTITPAGQAQRAEASRCWRRAQNAINEQLGIERVVQLHALLEDCLAQMDAPSGATDA